MTTGVGISDAMTPELQKFLKNSWGELDIEELSQKINYDLEIFSGFAIQVRWNLDGTCEIHSPLSVNPILSPNCFTSYTSTPLSPSM